MRVLFYLADQNPHRDRSMGITVYTDGLLRALHGRHELELEAIYSRSSFRSPAVPNARALPFPTDHTAGRLFADHAVGLLPSDADLWHFPKGHLPLLKPRRPCVGTIHDTIVMHYARHYPGSRSRLEFAYWRRVLRASLARLDLVCTVSHSARRAIEALCADENIEPPRIEVTYEGADWETRAGEPSVDKGGYVLHLASSLPHKRTRTVLEHWRTLQQRGVDLPPLWIVGPLDDHSADVARDLARVERQAFAAHAHIEELLGRARALLLPSEVEGFGLPALEAFYVGTPVVHVQNTAVAEMLEDFPTGAFELQDVDSFERALDAALSLSPGATASLARGLRERFSWARCADRTLDAYRAVLT